MDPFFPPAMVSVAESESPGLSQELVRYQQMRRKEKKLRRRVDYLEKQVALKGPLAVEVNLAMLLQEERDNLEMLRQRIASLEEHLELLQSLPAGQRTTIEADQLEQLISDRRAKQEQLRILQDNVNFLEEKQAQFGFDVPLNLANELKLARENLEKVQAQLQKLEKMLKEEWKIDPTKIENFDAMDEAQIRELASQIVERIKEQSIHRLTAVHEKYDALVMGTLEELRKAVYPDDESSVVRPDITEWGISLLGSFGGVSVRLKFDPTDKPIRWDCTCYHYDGRVVGEKQADLSRESLIAALRALYWKEKKKWWQFWHRPPALPKNWE